MFWLRTEIGSGELEQWFSIHVSETPGVRAGVTDRKGKGNMGREEERKGENGKEERQRRRERDGNVGGR